MSERVADAPNDDDRDHARSRRFWLHLVDNLLRRMPLYVLPVVLMLALGGWVANGVAAEYSSIATLDASSNPLIGDLDVRGTTNDGRYTTAQATANFVEEQLRTDVFATAVAESAGLGSALENALIGPADVRDNISAYPNGDSIIIVKATWSDPATSQLLAQATIDSYRDYIVATVATDSLAAIDFYTEVQAQAALDVETAQRALEEYIAGLPVVAQGLDLPIEQELTIQRLNNTLDRAESNVDQAANEIETARLQAAQSRSDAGQSVRVIDPPSRAVAPEPRRTRIASIVLAFGALGLLISGTALVLTTALDRSVRFALDVTAATGSATVITIPEIKQLGRRKSGEAETGRGDGPGGEVSNRARDRLAASDDSATVESDAGASDDVSTVVDDGSDDNPATTATGMVNDGSPIITAQPVNETLSDSEPPPQEGVFARSGDNGKPSAGVEQPNRRSEAKP